MIKSATITQTGDLELEHNIDGNPDYGHLTVSLNLGEKFIADRGALAWMSKRGFSAGRSAPSSENWWAANLCSSASSATTRADQPLSGRPSLARSAIERCLAIRLS